MPCGDVKHENYLVSRCFKWSNQNMQETSHCGRLDRHAGNLNETTIRVIMIFNTNTNNKFA